MGMFETTGRLEAGTERKENTLRKLEGMNRALRHQEPDRVPISDFFWGGFIQRWRQELGLPADADPYYHYDLDWIVTVPNMDPWIRPFETLKETPEEIFVKTGFGAVACLTGALALLAAGGCRLLPGKDRRRPVAGFDCTFTVPKSS